MAAACALETNLEVNIMEYIEQFVGSLLDLTKVDDHIVNVDWNIESEQVFKSFLWTAEPNERVEDEFLELV